MGGRNIKGKCIRGIGIHCLSCPMGYDDDSGGIYCNRNSNRKIIGIDMDDTIIPNFVPELINQYNEKYNDDLIFDNIKQWELPPLLKPECKNIFKEFINDDFFEQLHIDENAVEIINKLSIKYDIYFVTAGDVATAKARSRMLKKYFPCFTSNQLVMCIDKHIVDMDLLIDDNVSHVLRSNCESILFERPWNTWFDNEAYGINRISQWDENTEKLIEKLLNK